MIHKIKDTKFFKSFIRSAPVQHKIPLSAVTVLRIIKLKSEHPETYEKILKLEDNVNTLEKKVVLHLIGFQLSQQIRCLALSLLFPQPLRGGEVLINFHNGQRRCQYLVSKILR